MIHEVLVQSQSHGHTRGSDAIVEIILSLETRQTKTFPLTESIIYIDICIDIHELAFFPQLNFCVVMSFVNVSVAKYFIMQRGLFMSV